MKAPIQPTTRRVLLAFACVLAACADAGPRIAMSDVATLADDGAGNPTVALDPRTGTGYAAWIETHDNISNVYIATIDSAGARSAPVRVNDIDGDAAPHDQAPPQVEVAPDGTVYVVWQNNTVVPGRRFPASDLRLARSTDGARTFEPAIFVNEDAGGPPTSHTFQDIAVAPDGTVYVSWIDGRARTAAEDASMDDASMDDASMHASMHDASMPGSQVRIAKSTDGGRTFAPSVVAYDNVCPCCRTSLAIADDGRIVVAFRTAADNIRDIAVVTSADGGASFDEPVRVHGDGWSIDACPHAGASIAFDGAGRLHVAWYTGAPERQGVWHAISDDGGQTFGTPSALLAGGWVPVSQVKLDAAEDGSVWMAWDDRREASRTVQLAVSRDGGAPTVVGESVAGSSPAIAAAERVLVAWQDGAAARARVARPQR